MTHVNSMIRADRVTDRLKKALIVVAVTVAAAYADTARAVETGKLIEKDGQYVYVESMDPATRLLLERAYEKGIITQQERDQVIKESEARAYLMQPSFKLWYDRGFNFSMNDNAFLLKIRGRLQMRETTRWRNEAWRNPGDAKNFPELLGVFGDYRANRSEDFASQFNLRRARLLFLGHLINPDFKYFLQLGFETAENAQTPGAANLLDYYFLSTHLPLLNIQAGQYKVFFNRSQINNTASMQFAERAPVQDAFTANGLNRRDIGITIMNDDELYPVNYYLGIFNGAGPLFNRYGTFNSEEVTINCPGGQTGGNPFPSPAGCPTNTRNLNANFRNEIDKLMYAGRLQWNILGRPGYGEGDLAYSETPQMAVGGGLAYNPGINTSTDNAYVGIDLANLNFRRQLATFGNGRQLGWGVVNYLTQAYDAVFKYRGFSMQGEYYFKNIDRTFKGAPCLQINATPTTATCTATAPQLLGNAMGFYVQSGYYLIPRKVEVAARYSYWDPDTNAAGDLIRQADVSLNWFPFGTYDYQVMLTYSYMTMGTGGYAIGRSAPLPVVTGTGAGSPSGAVPVDAVGGTLIENALRIQFQIFF
jgi:hypothetical protein